MKPIEFPGCNIVYAKDQREYLPLPAQRGSEGEVISCWKLGFLERLKVLFTGKMYLSLLTFNRLLQPQKMSVQKPKVEK